MPYIAAGDRPEIDASLRWVLADLAADFSAAKLNYVICRLANAYIEHHGLRYEVAKDVQGVLHGALVEFDARVVTPYEAQKIIDNGTVWTCLEEKHPEITDEWIEANTIRDEGSLMTWLKCYEGECDLHLVAPGVVACDNCDKVAEDTDFQQGEQ